MRFLKLNTLNEEEFQQKDTTPSFWQNNEPLIVLTEDNWKLQDIVDNQSGDFFKDLNNVEIVEDNIYKAIYNAQEYYNENGDRLLEGGEALYIFEEVIDSENLTRQEAMAIINSSEDIQRIYSDKEIFKLLDECKDFKAEQLCPDSDNIKVKGHKGTWYVVDNIEIDKKDYFLLEHEIYGDEAANIIVDIQGNLVLEDVYNGFDDLDDILITNDKLSIVSSYMDDDKRELLHSKLASCEPIEFIQAYIKLDPQFLDLLKNEFFEIYHIIDNAEALNENDLQDQLNVEPKYTGYKTEDGAKIHEGDILTKYSNYSGKRFKSVVVYSEEDKRYWAMVSEDAGIPLKDLLSNKSSKVEIIGNNKEPQTGEISAKKSVLEKLKTAQKESKNKALPPGNKKSKNKDISID